jgi:phenylacetate-CoA ligase
MKVAISRKNIWERAPQALRLTVGGALGLLPPALVLGSRFRGAQKFIRASQWWDDDRIRAYQTARLRELATAAYRTSYWRAIFDESGVNPATITLDSLTQLPYLTRQDVRGRLATMWTKPPTSASVDYVATSGSTGDPIGFYIGADRSPAEYAYTVTSWGRAGYELGMPLAVFRGRPVAADHQGLRHEYDPLFRTHSYSVYHMSEQHMSRYLAHIATLGSCFLHGYPSSIYALARHLIRTGGPRPLNVKGVLLESETVYPGQRALIEEVFRGRCFSSYGQTEKVVAASECEFSTDYHVWPTYGVCELVDARGRAITTPGRRGEIVGTSFLNCVVPFIRYRTGDYATLAGVSCPHCGRQQLVLKDLRGHRVQEMLVAVDGSLVPWTALNMHDDTFENVLRFQFYQDTPGAAVLRVVPAAQFTPVDQRRITANLRKKLADRIEIRIELLGALPTAPNGKAVYVDQRVEGLEPLAERDDEAGELVTPRSAGGRS